MIPVSHPPVSRARQLSVVQDVEDAAFVRRGDDRKSGV